MMLRRALRLPAATAAWRAPLLAAAGRRSAVLHASAAAAAPSDAFKAAAAAVNALPPAREPPPDVKLELYALYKQATAGRCTAPKPGMFDVVGRAKWDAWSALGDLPPSDAEARYLAAAARLGAGAGAGAGVAPSSAPTPTAAAPSSPYTTIKVATDASTGVRTLSLARPEKRNAISWDMYREVQAALAAAAADDAVRVLVVTGEGPFYSAGNDLSNFLRVPSAAEGGPARMAADARATMEAFVGALIDFPKLLVAAVNGPAVGLPVTTLPLFDLVYASHAATFHAPLVGLGQTPEGCSSVTFPALMGHARATELLVLGRKLTAQQAAGCGLVCEVFPSEGFAAAVGERAAAAAALPPQAVRKAKALLRASSSGPLGAAALHAANAAEGAVIAGCWLGPEVASAVAAFMGRARPAAAKP